VNQKTLIPRWTLLRRIGNSVPVRLTVLIPIIGYLLIFNSYVVHYLELAKEFVGAQPPTGVSTRLLLIYFYFGLCALAVGSVIYGYMCPEQVQRYDSAAAYISGDAQSIGDFGLESIESELHSSPLADRHSEIRNKFDSIRKARGERMDESYPVTEFRKDLTVLKSESAKAILHLYFEYLDQSRLLARGFVAVLFITGFIFLSVPAIRVFWRVCMLLNGQLS
jgi:hypothetical protein